MALTDDQLDRYARHLILKEVGGPGQAKLLASRVLVLGAGGLGAPVLLYLAAAGVGQLTVVDDDRVDLSNLQRQVIHATPSIGRLKTESAAEALKALNPDVSLTLISERLTLENAPDLVAGHDLIIDGSDNFAARFAAHDAAFRAGIPFLFGAVGQFDGQIGVFEGHKKDTACLRCFMPEAPPAGAVMSCAEAGVLGALTGVMGSLQALEALKCLLSMGETLSGKLMLFDGLGAEARTIAVRKDPKCPLCGSEQTAHG